MDQKTKDQIFEEFLGECQKEIHENNFQKFSYLESIGYTNKRDNYNYASQNSSKYSSQNPVILIGVSQPFEERSDKSRFWLFIVTLITLVVWLLMAIIPDLNRTTVNNQADKRFQINLIKTAWVTILIAFSNILIYFLITINGESIFKASVESLLRWGGNFSGLTLNPEWWRLITSVFLHANIFHLAFNIYALISIGVFLEPIIGRIRFFGYYLIMGIGASISSLIWNDFNVSVGASGAIFGLFGFYFIYSLVGEIKKRKFGRSISIFITIIINLYIGWSLPFIDNAAHAGGLVIGMACAGILILLEMIFGSDNSRAKNSAFILSAVCCLLLYLILYTSLSRDRSDYYSFYKRFLNNEKAALQIQEEPSAFHDPLYKTNLDSAYAIWGTVKNDLHGLKIKNRAILDDMSTLYSYAGLRQKGVRYLQKMIENGTFTFLDSLWRINSKIGDLPKLCYPLNFYPPEREKDTLRNYNAMFDKDWLITTKVQEAVYSRRAKIDSKGRLQGWTHDFYKASNTMQMSAYYKDNLLDGIALFFHPNGNYESMGMMSKETKVGKWQYFYKNGQLQSEMMYNLGEKSEIIAFYDSNGVQLLSDGNGYIDYLNESENIAEKGKYINSLKDGIWTGYYENGNLYYEERYIEGKLVEGRSLSPDGKNRYSYSQTTELPVPNMGWQSYYQYLDSAMNDSNEHNLEMSIMELFIDSTGLLKNVYPKTIVGGSFEALIVPLIRKVPEFIPGKIRGQNIGMRTYLNKSEYNRRVTIINLRSEEEEKAKGLAEAKKKAEEEAKRMAGESKKENHFK